MAIEQKEWYEVFTHQDDLIPDQSVPQGPDGFRGNLLQLVGYLANRLSGHRHDNATTSADGFMGKEDKAKVHNRAHGVASQDHSDVRNGPQEGQVLVYRPTGPQGLGFYFEAPGAASVPNATETEAGKVEKGTLTEGRAGTDSGSGGPLYVPPSVLYALLREMRGSFAGDGPTIFPSVTIPGATSVVSGDLRGLGGIPSDARGVEVMVRVPAHPAARDLYIDSADAPNAASASPRHRVTAAVNSGQYRVPLGQSGSNAGKIKLSVQANDGTSDVNVWATGWWR